MKTLYKTLVLAFMVLPLGAFGQIKLYDNGEQITNPAAGNLPLRYLGTCDTISTTLTTNNGSDGNMFTIQAKQDIIIKDFDGNFGAGSGIAKVYYKWGTYSGFELNAAAWALIDSATYTSAGQDSLTHIPVDINLQVDSGEVISFYVTTDGLTGINYLDGTTEGAIYTSNADLNFYEGVGIDYPFVSVFTPRIWSGRINYCRNINYCDELFTTSVGGNGNDGIIFEITSLQDVVLRTFETLIDDTGYVAIYYKAGTYVGFDTNPGAWTLADSVLVNSTITGLTEIPIDVDLYLNSGQLYSFIIIGDGVSQSLSYSNGTAIGAPFINDNYIQIREGEGYAFPWGGGNDSPRIFNGIVHYCKPGPLSAIACNDLFVTNMGGNGNNGIMFDVDAKQDAVEIQGFQAYLNGPGISEVRIYYKDGTHIGFDSNDSLWTLIDSMNVNVTSDVQLVTIPINVEQQIAPNGKMAFFIYTTGGVEYTNGNGVTVPDTIFTQDNFIRVREGSGTPGIFTGGGFNPRVFNGIVEYCYLESWIGIEEHADESGIALWPNPNNGVFNLAVANAAETIRIIEIYTMNGQPIRQIVNPGSTSIVDVSNEAAGVYIIKVVTDQSTYSRKFILSAY